MGGVHGDYVWREQGTFGIDGSISSYTSLTGAGAFYRASQVSAQYWLLSGTQGWGYNSLGIDNNRVVPTGNKHAPRAFGVLPCVYLGVPR